MNQSHNFQIPERRGERIYQGINVKRLNCLSGQRPETSQPRAQRASSERRPGYQISKLGSETIACEATVLLERWQQALPEFPRRCRSVALLDCLRSGDVFGSRLPCRDNTQGGPRKTRATPGLGSRSLSGLPYRRNLGVKTQFAVLPGIHPDQTTKRVYGSHWPASQLATQLTLSADVKHHPVRRAHKNELNASRANAVALDAPRKHIEISRFQLVVGGKPGSLFISP